MPLRRSAGSPGWHGLLSVVAHFPNARVLAASAYAAAVWWALTRMRGVDELDALAEWLAAESGHTLVPAFAVIGGVLGMLVAARVNIAYARWWEGQSVWGALIFHALNLTQQVRAAVGADTRRGRIQSLVVAFGYSSACHLRSIGRAPGDAEAVLPEDMGEPALRHLSARELALASGCAGVWGPHACLDMLRAELAHAFADEAVSRAARARLPTAELRAAAYVGIDRSVSGLAGCIGVALKIRLTPMPPLYDAQLTGAVALYLAVAPLALLPEMGVFSVPAVGVIAAAMLSILQMVRPSALGTIIAAARARARAKAPRRCAPRGGRARRDRAHPLWFSTLFGAHRRTGWNARSATMSGWICPCTRSQTLCASRCGWASSSTRGAAGLAMAGLTTAARAATQRALCPPRPAALATSATCVCPGRRRLTRRMSLSPSPKRLLTGSARRRRRLARPQRPLQRRRRRGCRRCAVCCVASMHLYGERLLGGSVERWRALHVSRRSDGGFSVAPVRVQSD